MEVQSQINENTVISPQERQEFDEFKRQKRVAEARAIISRIELSFTAPSADRATLRRLLKDGEKAGLGGVCVTPYLVKPCSDFLGTASAMSVAAAISAWGGSDTTDIKVRQVKRAIRDGADAVEVAAPLSAVKEGSWGYVKREFKKLKSAAKTDRWFHVQKIHGSHVIVACEGREPDGQTMEEAAQLAAYYSQARQGQNVPVDTTLVRHVKKPAGAMPGMVVYDRYTTLYLTPDESLPERLHHRPASS